MGELRASGWRFNTELSRAKREADIVVKAVMIGLLLASIWVWAIIFEKTATLRRVNGRADAFEDTFWSGKNLEDLYDGVRERPRHPMEAVFAAAMREWQRSAPKLERAPEGTRQSVRERIERALSGEISLGVLTDLLAGWMDLAAELKWKLLAEPRVEVRARTLGELLKSVSRPTHADGAAGRFPPEFSVN